VGGDPGEGSGEAGEEPFEDPGHGGFTHPAQAERGEGDAELGGGDDTVEGLDPPERQPSFAVAIAGHLFEAGFPGGHNGKLGRHEKRVREDQSEDDCESKTDGRRRFGGRHIPEG